MECGFIKNKSYNEGSSEFDKVSRINKFVENSLDTTMHVVMIREEDIDEDFDKNTQDVKIDGVRILFKKENTDSAIKKAMFLKDKGYKIFLQPATVTDYSIDEFKYLIELTNEVKPHAFYIVDTLGILQKDELLKLFNIADKNLAPDIAIGNPAAF